MEHLSDIQILNELIDIYEFEKSFLLKKKEYIEDIPFQELETDLSRLNDYIAFFKRMQSKYAKIAGEGKALS